MGSQRSRLKSVSAGTSGRQHQCKANSKHVLFKGDPVLVIKIARNKYHYCVDCALKFIATARTSLFELEADL